MKLSKGWKIALVVIAVLLLWFVFGYNKLIRLDQSVVEKWANVETQYQRRFDLVPNLVSTVKAYAAHEEQLFTEVTKLRTQWQQAVSIDERVAAAQQLDFGLGRLIAVSENYPQLRASENFLSLQDELAGTENRVATERTRYNEAVRNYNTAVKRIPTNLIASIAGFDEKRSFEAQQGSAQAPKVNFE